MKTPLYTATTELIVPPGKRTGANLRTDKPGERCAFLEEGEHRNAKIKLIDEDEWKPHIKDTPRRSTVSWILDQNGNGSCATEAATGGQAFNEKKQGRSVKLYNPLFMYHTTSGGRDGGSNLGDNLVFLRDKGVCEESIWPRSKGFRARPSDEAYENALLHRLGEYFEISSTTGVGTALILDFVVIFGWQGHCCYLIDLIDERTAIFVNSWGKWGDNGCGTIRLSAINFGYGCYCYQTAA